MRGLALAVAAGALAWLGLRLARRFVRYEIAGPSMESALRPGDWVIVDREAYASRPPRPGEVVLARDPREPGRVLVKRAAGRAPDGGVWLLGDHAAASTDSRVLGAVPEDAIRGRVRWRYWPPPLGAVDAAEPAR